MKKNIQDIYVSYKNGEDVEPVLIAMASIKQDEPNFASLNFRFKHTDEVPAGSLLATFKIEEQKIINIFGDKITQKVKDPSSEWKGRSIKTVKKDDEIHFISEVAGIFLIQDNKISVHPFDYTRLKIIEKEEIGKITISIKGKTPELKPISISTIEEYVALKEINPSYIDWKKAQEVVVKSNSGTEITSAEIQTAELQTPIKVEVGLSKDELYAHISIYFPKNRPLKVSYEQVKKAINAAKIVHGFEWDDIKQLIQDVNENVDSDGIREDLIDHVFAIGDEPIEGKDAVIEFHVDFPTKTTEKDSRFNDLTNSKKRCFSKRK